jgi:alpha-mannosidase
MRRWVAAVALSVIIALPAHAQFDRAWKIYVVPYSHVDVGYTDSVAAVIQAHNRYLDSVVAFIRSTAGNSTGERFKWTVEIPWVLESWLASRPPAVIDTFMAMVRRGSIEVGAMHFSLQTDLCGDEELVRSLYYGRELEKMYGIDIRTALQNDTPGFAWGLAQVLARAGVPYFSTAMNSALSSFYTTTTLPNLFYWKGQDGSRVLHWRCLDKQWAYLEGGITYQVYGSYSNMETRITNLLSQLVAQGYPYDAVMINCATGDNGAPQRGIVSNVQQWNAAHPTVRMTIATISEFFDDVSSRYSTIIPEYAGDAPNWWTWSFASSATGGYALSRQAQVRLPAAETFSTIASQVTGISQFNKQETFRRAYINNLLFEDHNLGGLTESGNVPFWTLKMEWVRIALAAADAESGFALAAIGSTIATGAYPTIAVFNPLPWQRSGIVKLPLTDPAFAGLQHILVVESSSKQPIPIQVLQDGSLAFRAEAIPPTGYRCFELFPRSSVTPPAKQISGNVLENDAYRVSVNTSTGGITSVFDKKLGLEIAKGDGAFNVYRYNGNVGALSQAVVQSDSGPVLQSITVKGVPGGSSSYEGTITLPSGLRQVDMFHTYTKLIPSSLESVDFFFRPGMASPRLRYEIPFGAARLFDDELTGFRTGHYAAGRWVNLTSGGGDVNVTIASDNATLVAAGTGAFDGSLRRLVSFNNSASAYRAGVGDLIMNFSLTSDSGECSTVCAQQFGHGFAAPLPWRLLPAHQSGTLPDSAWSFVKITPPSLFLSTLKKPLDREGCILRLWNPSAQTLPAQLAFSSPVVSAGETTILEEDKGGLPSTGNTVSLTLGPYEIKTILVVMQKTLAVEEQQAAPATIGLEQNFPNPFNPLTVISCQLPVASIVRLAVYDLLGREVGVLVNQRMEPGHHVVRFDATGLATGVYVYRLTAGTWAQSRKMLVIR